MPVIRPAAIVVAAALLAGCGLGAGPVPWPDENDRPDLVAQDLSSTPDQFILGHEVVVHVTIANLGKVAAGAFDVEFAVTPDGGYYPWPRERVGGLAPGASAVVDFVVEVGSPNDIPIRVTIDPDNHVKEASETNNVSDYVRQVTVPSG